MDEIRTNDKKYMIIKLAQYFAGLGVKQDEWTHFSSALLQFLKPDFVAFGGNSTDDQIVLSHWSSADTSLRETLTDQISALEKGVKHRGAFSKQIRTGIKETYESGFISTQQVTSPTNLALAFFPITMESQVHSVLIIGDASVTTISNEQLDLYLAVAGLLANTAQHLKSERELLEHRRQLENRVAERTRDLSKSNEKLQTEIAQRQKTEQRVDHLNRVLRAVSNVNQLIVRERDRDRLLKGACQVLIETRGYYNVWFALQDQHGQFIQAEHAGLGESYQELLNLLHANQLPRCATVALKTTDVVITDDPAAKCNNCFLSANHKDRAGMTTRLEHNDRIYGVLCASIPADMAQNKEEAHLLQEVAGDIAFALHNLDLESQRKRVEQERIESERRLRDTLEKIHLIAVTLDRDGAITFCNDFFLQLTGWNRDELVGKNWFETCLPASDGTTVYNRFLNSIKSGQMPSHFENEILTKSGDRRYVLWNNTLLKDTGGRIIGTASIGEDITERRQAEDELRNSEERLRTIIHHSAEMFYIHDTNHVLTYVSPQCERIFGYTPDEMMLNWTELATDNPINERGYQLTQKAIETGEQQDPYILELKRKNGKSILVEIKESPILDENNHVAGISGMLQDVTVKHQAVEALRDSEALYHSLVESLPINVLRKDVNGKFTFANSVACKTLDRDLDDIIGKTDHDLFPKKLAKKYERDDQNVLQSGELFEDIEEHFTADGEKLYVQVLKSPVLNFKKDITGIQVVFIDVTERQVAEKAIKESEEKFRLLAENSLDCIWTLDTKLRFTYLSPSLEQMMGFKPEEWIGTHLSSHFTKKEFLKVGALATKALKQYKTFGHISFETKMIDKKNQEIDLEITGKVLLNADGKLVGLQGITRDIRERKAAEQERQILQEQLLQSQKLESVGRLAGGVAHDFNNMLAVIMGRTEMLLMKIEQDDPQYHNLEEILKAAKRSADLIQQLLAFARKQTIAPKVINLNDAVNNALNMIHRLIGEDIKFDWIPCEDAWPIKMDPIQMDQILTNLCINSKDAIDGPGRITIETDNITIDRDYSTTHMEFKPGPYAKLSVSDNGCGMDEETVSQIFEPFFTTKGVGKGSGLGLSTVFGIVKQNNGVINVYSEPEQGTTFAIYLPKYKGKGKNSSNEASRQVPRGQSQTILLVEDEKAILEMTTTMLESQGYHVLSAATPNEALQQAKQHAGDIKLLMTDVVMPEMNGRELANRLLSDNPHLKRLFMSGYTANVIAHHGVLEKDINFIQKPFSMNDLLSKVHQVLNLHHSQK